MKDFKSVLALSTFVFFFASTSAAQENIDVNESITADKPFIVLLDGTAVLLNGFGAKATYAINDLFAVGGVASYARIKSYDNELFFYDYNHRIGTFGVIGELHVKGATPKHGLYMTLGGTYSKLNSEVNDSLFGTTNSSEDSKIGLIAAVGWQYRERLTNWSDVIIQVGLGYGNGGRVEWRMSGKETQIQSGALLDIKVGLQL